MICLPPKVTGAVGPFYNKFENEWAQRYKTERVEGEFDQNIQKYLPKKVKNRSLKSGKKCGRFVDKTRLIFDSFLGQSPQKKVSSQTPENR